MVDVVTIGGSPASPSRCAATLAWVRGELDARGLRSGVVNVRDLPPADLLWGQALHGPVRDALDLVEGARAVVVATPVYKAAYSGVLKTFLDLLPPASLANKAILPIATAGSLAHFLALEYALKPVLSALGGRQLLSGVCLLDADFAYHDDGSIALSTATSGLRLAHAIDELAALLAPHPTRSEYAILEVAR